MTRPSALRVVIGASVLVALLTNRMHIEPWSQLAQRRELAAWLPLELLLPRQGGWWALAAAVVVLVALFVARRAELVVGWLLFVAVGVMAALELSVRPVIMPSLGVALLGPVLGAWMVGLTLARARPPDARDAFAHEVTVGVYGATLTIAAISKLRLSGLAWVDGDTQCAVVFEHAVVSGGPLAAARLWASQHAWLCELGAVYVLLVELAGVLFVVPALRRPLALLVVGVFASLAFFVAIAEVEWALVAVGLAWSTLGAPTAAAHPWRLGQPKNA